MISRTAEPVAPAGDPAVDFETPTAPKPLRLSPEALRPLQQLSTARLLTALAATGRFGGALVERRYTDSFASIAGPA